MKTILQKLLPFALLLLVALGCQQVQKGLKSVVEPKTIAATDGSCEVTVPGLWSKSTDLNDEAILQASYPLQEMYVMVFKESRGDFADNFTIDDYAELVRKDAPTRIPDAQFTPATSSTINTLDAREFEMSGTAEKVKAKFIYAVVASKDNFYQIISWTLPSQYAANKDELVSVLHSFKATDAGAPNLNTNTKAGKK
ncbi:MAG TPA: hypothetical protein VGO50_14465 [Pyrinomonadaceae bacterium]|jgi:hypothetical protein|nr:hypothetical protein [Pyrinomonadaceae bacterium]